MRKFYFIAIAIGFGLYALVFLVPRPSAESSEYPKKANYFLRWDISESHVRELAKWDLVILDMENQLTSPAQMKRLRELNPDILILAYITPQEIRRDAAVGYGALRRKLAATIADSWYLSDVSGGKLATWPGTWLLNVSSNAPVINGMRLNDRMAQFVATDILGSGLWDGVFYDNAWENVTWFNPPSIDSDRDGVADSNPNVYWQQGLKDLYSKTRSLSGGNYIIVGNGNSKMYREELNGIMLESFPNQGGWRGTMNIYDFFENGNQSPRVMVINRNTLNHGSQADYRSMRFGLASALMGGAYYSFDYGDSRHADTWWYDEYDAKLGSPMGQPVSLSNAAKYQDDVWRRDYSNGLVLVNSTDETKVVDLGGEFEKIIGTQDPKTNNGQITDTVTLPPKDGLLMYKTFRTLNNVFFVNGSFARFYKLNGARARNGFFVYEEGVDGSAKIFNGDLDGDGKNEKIVVTGPRLEIFNPEGFHWVDVFPYGPDFKGDIRIAIGRFMPGSNERQLVVAPSVGGKVLIYRYYGEAINEAWYPLGTKYQGGFSVALGNTDAVDGDEIVLGVGRNRTPEILIYNSNLAKPKKRIIPFDPRFKQGVNVSVGDFDGNGVKEIAAVTVSSLKPLVRVFDGNGKKMKEFYVSGIFGNQAISLGADGIGFDGADEIVTMSSN